MEKRSYEILSGNTVTAVWQNDTLTVVNSDLLPLYLRRVANADLWLETRAIDSHRANSRLLKKALRLAEKDDVSTVIHVNGATITDNYWIRPIGSGHPDRRPFLLHRTGHRRAVLLPAGNRIRLRHTAPAQV